MSNFYGQYPIEGTSPEAGVISLNGLTGALTLIAGTGISITPSGSSITITNTNPSPTPSPTPAPNTFAAWDANDNLQANNFLPFLTTTASTGGTLTLTAASAQIQVINGTGVETVVLPVASTLAETDTSTYSYTIFNQSTANVTVTSSGGTQLDMLNPDTMMIVTLVNSAGGTGTAPWVWTFVPFYNGATGDTQFLTVGGLEPLSNNNTDIGDPSNGWFAHIHGNDYRIGNGSSTTIANIFGGDPTTNDVTFTDVIGGGNMYLSTANNGSGAGGNIVLAPGTGSSTNGTIQLNDQSGTITAGKVWTATASTGAGSWQALASGANTTLSNLTSPTAINQSLLSASNATLNIGSPANMWLNASIYHLTCDAGSGGGVVVDAGGQTLDDLSGVTSVLWNNRQLHDPSGGSAMDWNLRHLISTSLTVIDWSLSGGQNILLNSGTTLGAASTTPTHAINTSTGTNGAGVLTLTNAPTGRSGNPAGYITITVNGTLAYLPYWT